MQIFWTPLTISIEFANEFEILRKGLLRFRYPFRPYWKRVAWGIGIFVGICCSVLVITYGVRFDIQASKEIDPEYVEAFESKCELSKSHEEKKNFGS